MHFEQFVAERQRSLFRFAVVLCGDPVQAEEMVQNVLGRTFERWQRIDAADDANAYVRRMVVNEFLDSRRLLRRSTPVAEFFDDQLPEEPDHADRHCDEALLAGELGKLPAKQRAALVLRYYAGMPYAEVAEAMGCRESTARGYAARALAALRIELTPHSLAASASEMES